MMNPFSSLRVALDALLVNKGRTCLTSLGIVIGIMAVIALVAAGDGARAKLDERLGSLGKNLIIIRPGARTQQGMVADFTPLTRADADVIRKQVRHLLVGVAETHQILRIVSTPTANASTSVCGTVPELQSVRTWTVRVGRFITDEDVRKQAPVCVLGETVRRKLFPRMEDPIGRTVRIDRLQLRVVGLLAVKGRSPTGADQDEQVFMPVSTLQHRLVGEDKLSAIMAAARDEATIDRAKLEVSRVLREKLRQKPGSESFDVSSVHEFAELAQVATTTLGLLVAVIASISLVVGGIGIMNIMLVSVTERTREIGLRMAVGA